MNSLCLYTLSIQLQLPSPPPSHMPGSPSRDVPCWLPTLDPSNLQIREVEAFENPDMADRLSRKVRRLPIIISFSLMRCLLSLPSYILSKQMYYLARARCYSHGTRREYKPGGKGGSGNTSLLQLKRMSER